MLSFRDILPGLFIHPVHMHTHARVNTYVRRTALAS